MSFSAALGNAVCPTYKARWQEHGFVPKPEAIQWLARWTAKDRERLALRDEVALVLRAKRKESRLMREVELI